MLQVYLQKPYNKYKAVRQTYNGYNYDSKLEASRAYELDMLKKAKQIKDYTRQFKVELYFYDKQGNQIPYKSWKIDFCIENLDGTFTLEEVKGMELADYKLKRDILEKIWLPEHPDYNLVVLKQSSIRKFF